MQKIFFFTGLYFLLLTSALGQGSVLVNEGLNFEILDRLEIKTGITPEYYSNLRLLNREDVVNFALLLDTVLIDKSEMLVDDLSYLFNDNNEFFAATNEDNYRYTVKEKPLFKYFYKTPANLYEIDKKDFYLRVSPIINFQYAVDEEDEQPIFLNLRGLEIRGGIDDRIYFYTNIHEQQARYPQYVNDFIDKNDAIPGASLFKNYRSTIFNIDRGYDFTNAQALLGFNITKHIGAQFGHGRNFIGNGYRSMLLSDFSTNYFFLKLNWRVGKFHLQNIFAETAGQTENQVSGNNLIPKKYMATHYFGYRPFDKVQIGLFETVIFNRENGFELQYLNPIILYRTVETVLGSPDNVLLGADLKWNFLKGFQLYSQFLLDEFKFDELFIQRRGWWGNKYSGQVGLKIVDFAKIESLDIQTEFNFARPFTYSSRDSTFGNYAHYNQALAHPLGNNFKEFLVILKYRPFKKLYLQYRFINAKSGDSLIGQNIGTDINQANSNRTMDFSNETGQGIAYRTSLHGVDISYKIFHNTFIDFTFFQRTKTSEDLILNQSAKYIGGGIRLNINKVRNDF